MDNIYQFNDIIYDSQRGELIRKNQSVYLRRKVAAVLNVLVENRSRIVEREELLTSIWREGKMRDNSLLQCIRELRRILGDNAKQSQFIKTYHTKGYQWIHATTEVIPSATYERSEQVNLEAPAPHTSDKKTPIQTKRWSYLTKRLILIQLVKLGAFLALSLLSLFYWLSPVVTNSAGIKPNSIKLAILPFKNHTGDSSLDWVKMGLSDMLMSVLAQSPEITVVPVHVIQDAQLSHKLSLSENQLLATLDADYLIKSQISLSKLSTYDFSYQIINRHGVVKTQTLPTADAIDAIPLIATYLSQQLMSTDKARKPLPLFLLSSNHQANLDYANGIHALRTKGAPLAKRYFEAALLNDSNFIWAKAQLAKTMGTLGDWEIAKRELHTLLKLPKLNQNPALQRFVKFCLANILLDQSQFEKAETLFQEVITLSEQDNKPYLRASALWRLSKISEHLSQWEKQYDYAQRAMSQTKKLNSLPIKAENLYYLGSPSNSRLELDQNIDMQENRLRLERALQYYQQLEDVPNQAKTLFSMGKNYDFSYERRIKFLTRAESLYRQLNNKMALANVLSYTGFLYIQYHRGAEAIAPVQMSLQISKSINAVQADLQGQFLLAFAELDQGISQRDNQKKYQHLRVAAKLFVVLCNDTRLNRKSQLFADASLLLGWTNSEQGKHQSAIIHITNAMGVYQNLKLTTSIAYSVMSLVKEHIMVKNWQEALQFINEPNPEKRTRQYLARSYYELKQYYKALELAELNKRRNHSQWTVEDEAQLVQYRQVTMTKQYKELPPEPSAHSTYCEAIPESEA